MIFFKKHLKIIRKLQTKSPTRHPTPPRTLSTCFNWGKHHKEEMFYNYYSHHLIFCWWNNAQSIKSPIYFCQGWNEARLLKSSICYSIDYFTEIICIPSIQLEIKFFIKKSTWASTSLSISCTTVQTSWMVFLIPILRSPTCKQILDQISLQCIEDA